MKIILITIFFATSVALICRADNSVAIGTNTISLLFPSSLDSESDKTFISLDLARVFSFAKNFDTVFATSSTSAYIELKRYQAPPPFPNDLRRQLNVSHTKENISLMVSEALASRYLAAKDFAQTNSALLGQFDNIVAAFNNGSVTNMNTIAQKEVFWMPKNGEISDAEMSEIIQMISSRLVLHYPSILNYDKNLPLDSYVGADIAD